jgi:transcriptional regulator with XRE-family HTH domain
VNDDDYRGWAMTNRLKATRESAGLSLGQAAKLLGWARGVLHAMEIDEGSAPIDSDLAALAALYRCSVAWLRGETAELSDENKALLRTVEHTGDRDTVREFMQMLSTRDPGEPAPAPAPAPASERTRDPGEPAPAPASERIAKIAAQMTKPGLASPQSVGSKRRYVRSQKQTRKHHCHWPGCTAQVPPAMWGCKAHWFALPKALRDRIWSAYQPGQEDDMTPSETYLQVAAEVQQWIREHGG